MIIFYVNLTLRKIVEFENNFLEHFKFWGPSTDADVEKKPPRSWLRRHMFFVSGVIVAFLGLGCTYVLRSPLPSQLTFCDRNSPALDCTPCPYLAKCSNGKARCPPNRMLMGRECVEHTNLEVTNHQTLSLPYYTVEISKSVRRA